MIPIIRGVLSLYSPAYVSSLVYMLQNTEYQAGPYLKWYWRTQNFTKVPRRRALVKTGPARLLALSLTLGMLAEALVGLGLIYLGSWHHLAGGVAFGLAVILAYPIVWAHLAVAPLLLGRWLVIRPKEKVLAGKAEAAFARHKAVKIAIAGSYGKTTMKEILATVLGEGKNVAATPANKNVPVAHAQFARNLTGQEDVLLIEYGEGAPGDVERFARVTHPTHAVITGVAPAHLDRYKTLAAAARDIFSVAVYLRGKNVYVNGESPDAKPFIKDSYHAYSQNGALGWRVQDVKVKVDGLKFVVKKGRRAIELKSKMLGRHQVGGLALAAALALELGMGEGQVKAGIAKTAPFEHRMQPYQLGGAWVIDDTYNGNIEGIHAGTALLKELPARRKIYVTPGLVGQGEETERVHEKMGRLIAASSPDVVVLMQNSTAKFIQRGLSDGNFKGELRIESDPLEFYTNLDQLVAAGDLVVMQNDWPDNYA